MAATTKFAEGQSADLDGLHPDDVYAHLEEVLSSPSFRTSQRSQQFLRCVVIHTLDGRADSLKERLIGEEIFGRPADYDTGQDSIVRVKANEVRRRLAQFYERNPQSPVRLEMPPGCYVVHFRSAPKVAVEEPGPAANIPSPPPAKRRWIGPAIGLAAASVLALAVWRLSPAPAPTPFGMFWQPFLSSSRDVIICLPTPDAYRIYGTDREAVVQALRPRAPGAAPPILPAAAIDDVRIVPEPGLLVGLGDARALMLVHSFVSGQGKTAQVRLGKVTTFTELRAGPSVLIGGFSNPWTVDLAREHRFAFSQFAFSPTSNVLGIRDNSTGKFVCQKPLSWEPRGNDDCAVVTRMIDSKTGHPLLIAAGLDHFGTFAVGEFLTQPKLLEAALRQAGAGWASKNIQIVIRVEKVRDDVGPPKVLAVHIW